jgi:NitT/TauT family transport system substrate-binding protein
MPSLDRRRFMQIAAASASAPLLHAAPARAQSVQTLRILTVRTDAVKTLLWAQAQNVFAAHGLAIDLVNTGSSAASLTALVGGSADIAAGSLFATFAAIAHGIPVKFIAPEAFYLSDHADSVLLVRTDSPIRNASDLNGKVIGVDSLKDLYTLATRGWVDNGGGDGASLKPVEIPPPEQLAALLAGRIDAGVFKAPFLSVALAGGKTRLLGKPLDAVATRFLISAWIADDDFIAKNPPAVKAFQTVMAQAGRYTNAHPDATVDLVAKFTGQDAAQVRTAVRATSAVAITLPDVQRPLDFAYKYKLIDHPLDAAAMLAPGFPVGAHYST